MKDLKENIRKLEIGLKNGNNIFIGQEKINVFQATLILVKLKELEKKESENGTVKI